MGSWVEVDPVLLNAMPNSTGTWFNCPVDDTAGT